MASCLSLGSAIAGPGIDILPDGTPSTFAEQRFQRRPQPLTASGDSLHVPRIVWKYSGHQDPHRAVPQPLQARIAAFGHDDIGKFPGDWLSLYCFGAWQRLPIAAVALASGGSSVDIDKPMLKLGARRAHAHRAMPLNGKAEHRRIPAHILHTP